MNRNSSRFATGTAMLARAGSYLCPVTLVWAWGCGSSNLDSRTCSWDHGNSAWNGAGVVGTTDLPSRCPYSVLHSGASMPFAVSLRAPSSSVTGNATFWIRNINSALEYFEAKAWDYDPEDGNKKLVAFQGSYSAGDFKSPNSGDSRPVDTAYSQVTALPWSTATNYAILPGNVQDSAMTSTTVVGEATVYRGYGNIWVSQPGLDTIQYAYQWRVDGSPIGGENGSRYSTSFGTTGNYVLSVINTRSDLTADTLYKNISVVGPPITATILGGSEVRPNIGSCYFYASASGGNGSYSYQWKKNGTPIGSDSPDLYVSTGTSDFTLSVTISESGFTTGEDEHYVTVSGGAPEEACNVFD